MEQEKKIAISIRNVTIAYRIFKKMSIKSLIFAKKARNELFTAVKNVSFEVPEGEIVGLIGKNGSGKSTLLRSVAGIQQPDGGEIDLHGHSISLLSIGVGFKPMMTGRENIMLSGLLLGFTEAEVKEKMEEIIEFSELGEFIDRPVKTYSSGMYSKLTFSITAVLETEIMLIDEVFSVGDEHFKQKSYQKMQELISDSTRTVLIVSHNLQTLGQLCSTVVWMNDGEIVKIGPTSEVLPEYKTYMDQFKPKKAKK